MNKILLLPVLLCLFLVFSCSTGSQKSAESEQEIEANAVPDAIAAVDIKEWPVPWEKTRPRDPFRGIDGHVWFVGQTGNYIAYLDPETEAFKRYEIREGTHPHNLIVGADGMVWFAGNLKAYIGKLNPVTGKVTEFPMPDERARDPHTLVFNQQGNIWFTVQGGNFVGYLNTSSGEIRLIEMKTENSRPYGIKIDSGNRPWIVLFGTNKLATIDPDSFELREIELPEEGSRPRRLEILADGTIYYVDYTLGNLGRYVDATGEFTQWLLPGGKGSRPYGTALDGNEILWIAESGSDPNYMVSFDPKSEEFGSVTPIPSGGGTIRHMYYHKPTNEVWFGTDTGNIGRVAVPRVL